MIYYIDKDYNSDILVLNFVNELLRAKYENVKFYCHNLGGYEVVFLLKILKTFNASCKEIADKYSINCVFRDDKILKIAISKKINGINRKFTIRDSYSLLNQSLSSLSKTFQVSTIKGIFPHKFSTTLNLFYTGNTPSITYYQGLSDQEHRSMFTSNWSFKDQAIRYLKDDLNSLFQVVSKANKQVFLDYGVNITDSLTISSLALKIFLSNYYNDNIPLVNKASVYADIKKVTMVVLPRFTNPMEKTYITMMLTHYIPM